MTPEARLLFILFFFLLWAFAALLPWAAVAVVSRGRGSAIALPLCIAAGCAFGVAVPVLGARDGAGFVVSVFAAFFASAAAAVAVALVTRRMERKDEAAGSAWDPSTRKRRAG